MYMHKVYIQIRMYNCARALHHVRAMSFLRVLFLIDKKCAHSPIHEESSLQPMPIVKAFN